MATTRIKQADFWQNHIDEYRSSALSRIAYCREHGLKPHQLDYRLGKAKVDKNKSGKGAFARVIVDPAIVPKRCEREPLRLLFVGGVTMELASDTDPSWIGQLISSVGGRQ